MYVCMFVHILYTFLSRISHPVHLCMYVRTTLDRFASCPTWHVHFMCMYVCMCVCTCNCACFRFAGQFLYPNSHSRNCKSYCEAGFGGSSASSTHMCVCYKFLSYVTVYVYAYSLCMYVCMYVCTHILCTTRFGMSLLWHVVICVHSCCSMFPNTHCLYAYSRCICMYSM